MVAAGLGLAAVCMVVFGSTQKQLQVGVLLGLWAGLIGAFLVVGSRRGQAEHAAQLAEVERRAQELHAAQLQVSQLQQAQLAAAEEARARQERELRELGEVQLSRESSARREADLHLELSLRREIERMMTEHLGLLRDEVAALRAEVVDKLGGQLRLERIETTRLIGSDLEALQHEIRRLAGSQDSIGAGPSPLPAGVSNISMGRSDIIEAELVEPVRQPPTAPEHPTATGRHGTTPSPAWSQQTVVGAEPDGLADRRAGTNGIEPRAAENQVAWSAAHRPAGQPEPARPTEHPAPVQPEPARPAAKLGQPEPPRLSGTVDLFAGLPRLSPLPDDLDLLPDLPAGPADRGAPAEDDRERAGYHGRRRATDEQEEPAVSGGRRRAPDDAPDDLFARLRRS
jgi:hypothetical protein